MGQNCPQSDLETRTKPLNFCIVQQSSGQSLALMGNIHAVGGVGTQQDINKALELLHREAKFGSTTEHFVM